MKTLDLTLQRMNYNTDKYISDFNRELGRVRSLKLNIIKEKVVTDMYQLLDEIPSNELKRMDGYAQENIAKVALEIIETGRGTLHEMLELVEMDHPTNEYWNSALYIAERAIPMLEERIRQNKGKYGSEYTDEFDERRLLEAKKILLKEKREWRLDFCTAFGTISPGPFEGPQLFKRYGEAAFNTKANLTEIMELVHGLPFKPIQEQTQGRRIYEEYLLQQTVDTEEDPLLKEELMEELNRNKRANNWIRETFDRDPYWLYSLWDRVDEIRGVEKPEPAVA